MIIKLSGAYLMILFTRTIWWNITKLCMWDYYFFETNMWDYYSLSTIKSGKRMHQSTLRIGILLYIAATLSSLIIYDCFISIPQLGHFAGGLLIPIDSARTISLDIQNLKVHLPVFTLSECCSPKQTLSSSLLSLIAAKSTWPAIPLQRARQCGRARARVPESTRDNHLSARLRAFEGGGI